MESATGACHVPAVPCLSTVFKCREAAERQDLQSNPSTNLQQLDMEAEGLPSICCVVRQSCIPKIWKQDIRLCSAHPTASTEHVQKNRTWAAAHS